MKGVTAFYEKEKDFNYNGCGNCSIGNCHSFCFKSEVGHIAAGRYGFYKRGINNRRGGRFEEGQDQATASDGTPEPSQEMEVVDESVPADSGSYGELFGDEDGSSGEGASEDELDWSELQE